MERILGQLMLIAAVPAIVALLGGSAHAWNPVAHYIMAQELGLDPNYANLPDAWPSYIISVITEKFCWSHSVQDTGYHGVGVPNTPTYPEDGRWPEYDMRILAKYKLKTPSATANKTVEGFAAHNAADQVVHYAFFPGGTTAQWLEHSRKEFWADYVVFILKMTTTSFDDDGQIGNSGAVFGANNRVLPNLAFRTDVSGDAQLLRLAQKVYRKNGRKTDADGTGVLDVDTVAQITAQFTWFNNEYGNTITEQFRLNDEWGSDNSWDEMCGYYQQYGWSWSQCMTRYDLAKTKAQNRVNFIRGM